MYNVKKLKVKINRGKIEAWLATIFLAGLAISLVAKEADGNVLWYVVGIAAVLLSIDKITGGGK